MGPGWTIILWILLVICGVFLVYFYLIRPTKEGGKLDFMKYAPIAHRGLHGQGKNLPENSLPAFRLAAEKGYCIETDLWVSKDGVPVCFHDENLMRMCGVEGKVGDYTLEELKEFTLAGTNHTIPTLAELLEIAEERVPLLIEFKGDGTQGIEPAAYQLLCRSKVKYAVQGFHPNSMKWFRTHAPKVMRGQLSANMMKDQTYPLFVRLAMTLLLVNVISRPHFVSYEVSGRKSYGVQAVGKMGGGLFFWTVRDQQTFDQARMDGDNLIFEGFLPDLSKPSSQRAGKAPKGSLETR